MTIADELESTILQLAQIGKGILAAEESLPTITKRFASIEVAPTVDGR